MFILFVNIIWLEISTKKYASEYEKLKKIKKIKKLIKSQKGSIDKFVINNKQNTTQNEMLIKSYKQCMYLEMNLIFLILCYILFITNNKFIH